MKFKVSGYGMLKPLPDITPEESLWISLLFVAGSLPGNNVRASFMVEEHNLERHFTKEYDDE